MASRSRRSSSLTWRDLLAGPAYVINLDRRPDRWQNSSRQLQWAGFTDARRWPAFDGRTGNAVEAFQRFGIHRRAENRDFHLLPGAQGCTLSQLLLLRHIIESGDPFATVFEDDVRFSRHWHRLGPAYLRVTPPRFDLLYLGSQIPYDLLPRCHPARVLHPSRRFRRLASLSRLVWPRPCRALGDVLQVPVYCLHAFTISRQGCHALLRFLTTQSVGIYTPDAMMYDAMVGRAELTAFPLRWFAWNAARLAPDRTERGSNPHWIQRNCGLVHQEESFGTDIQPRSGPLLL